MEPAEMAAPQTGQARKAKKPARRPKWLPEEFAKPEELARAYRAMKEAPAEREPALRPKAAEKPRLEASTPPEAPEPVYPGDRIDATPAPRDEDAPASEEQAPRLDFSVFEKEFCATGGICEESYARLEALGAPRWLVDRHIEGRVAVAEAARREILELIGGEERFEAIQQWARESLPVAELAAYEKAVKGGKEEAKLAVLGLATSYAKAVGDAPRLVGGGAGRGEGGPFANADALAQAIRDPRYRTDPDYRAEVVARLAQRSVF